MSILKQIESTREKSALNRSSRLQMFLKIDVLKNFAIFAEKHQCWSLEETLTQRFCCEYCEIFKNSFFVHPVTAFGKRKCYYKNNREELQH